jgi:long-subunit acyl-CoA synthetase (AMP-forming)
MSFSHVGSCFCCPVLEGYGLTENFGGAVCTNMSETQLGHVGAPIVCAGTYSILNFQVEIFI